MLERYSNETHMPAQENSKASCSNCDVLSLCTSDFFIVANETANTSFISLMKYLYIPNSHDPFIQPVYDVKTFYLPSNTQSFDKYFRLTRTKVVWFLNKND